MANNPRDDVVPDTAMATGNDEGRPGEETDERPLGPDELAVLAALETPGPEVVRDPVESSPAAAAAADDDAPLPLPLPSDAEGRPDGLAPDFRPPSEG